jgi:thiamine monophosphate synthase
MIKILMTNPYSVNFELNTINALFERGLDRLIISKPKFDSAQIEKYILQINPKYHTKLILIDELALAEKYKVAGILISKEQINKFLYKLIFLNPFLRRNKHIEVYQKVKMVAEIDKLDKCINRVLIYPTFIDHYKENIIQFFDHKSLQERKNKNILVFATGGVNPSRLPDIYGYNFDGYVMHSTIWRNSTPLERFDEFIQFAMDRKKTKIK